MSDMGRASATKLATPFVMEHELGGVRAVIIVSAMVLY